MTMTRRLALFIACLLLLAFGGSFAIHGLAARQSLQRQLELRNREAAFALALALSQGRGDPVAMQAVAAAQFEQGRYLHIVFSAAGAGPSIELQRAPRVPRAPAWFIAVLPLAAEAGRASVSDGKSELGELRVEADAAWADDALWDACAHTAALMAALALAAAALTTWALRAWQRPLQATVAQALALAEGRFIEADEPALPELRSLTRSMNTLVRRLREVFAVQAQQVALLQRQALVDDVSGLPLRVPFVGQLQQRLAEPGGPGAALILLRVLQLEALNSRLGHEATDRLLGAIAGVLLTYVERVLGAFAGRLNGSDFALCLPVAGVGRETAESLRQTLASAPALRSAGIEIVIGAADGLRDTAGGVALATADAALARAEAAREMGEPGAGLAVEQLGDLYADAVGSRAWREQITAALAEGRTRLAEFRVVDREGQLIHLECPLRVQLKPGGDYQTAARWLALARRSRLMPAVDLAAAALALQAIRRDGLPRAVHAAPASLVAPGFVAAMTRQLQAAAEAARLLSIECTEGLRPDEGGALAEAAAAWRPLGVRLGVEHAGASPLRLPALQSAGLAYVKVDARHLRGAAKDEAVRGYAQSLVALIHGLGLRALAESIDDAQDLAALWALGFDGATGAAVSSG
jgi:EAL domain-containing protein (putative c-di-GMP-specific phosphodiesterase class I)/GGDEF domain-containing protein